jgi:hypothetical protein
MTRLYGFGVLRRDELQKDNLKTFATPVTDDGAVTVSAGGVYGTYVDLDGSVKTEADLVTKYREMALQPEIDAAVEAIVNEAIVNQDGEPTVKIIAEDKDLPPRLTQIIEDEFDNILTLLEFQTKSFDVFRRFYIDGRMYFHIVIDENNMQEGIKELRFLDPRKIRKIKEVVKQRISQGAGQVADIPQTAAEYFFYSEKAMNSRTPQPMNSSGNQIQGIKIAKDSIVHVTSGIIDSAGKLVLSYLHQAIKPLNQLKALEDASIIYTLARAPQRRIFYIDTGQLPPMKAEQYIRKMMFKNRLVYDAESGEVRDDRKHMTMLEDFWLARREGGRGTEIDTIGGDENIFSGSQVIVDYFMKRLSKSLKVPVSRLDPDTVYLTGRSTQISRDELSFSKFIDRLRLRFNDLFLQALEKQLILKQLITPEDWDVIKPKLKFQYKRDNYFSELKDLEIITEKLNVLERIHQFAGIYYSHTEIRKNILRQTDEDIERNDAEIAQEWNDPRFQPVVPPMGPMGPAGNGGGFGNNET